ncbi:MAG: DUF924 domain-containing protein [Zetaproteobacteria bacterium]|nr:DUF924 domain-containing protein [Zetaproteobacteria bacterium]
MLQVEDVLHFWFEELTMSQWYTKDPDLDASIRKRFGELHRQATLAELVEWRTSFDGRVAEIIVLDQFSRNLFRDSPQAFAYDGMSLVLAQEAIAQGALDVVNPSYQHHFLLPYMHSESLWVHERAVELRQKYGLDLEYELQHLHIIERFGRYPHRNAILGRISTAEEAAFLQEPDSSF